MIRTLLKIALVVVAAMPAVFLRLSGVQLDPLLSLFVFGAGVAASAFALMWAAETARVDIAGGLAIGILALVAVLPEYAVDLYFAFTAGHRPEYAAYAAANMTGANRLLLGLGWPLIALVFYIRSRRDSPAAKPLKLDDGRRIEVGFLALTGLYSFVIPLTRRLAWYDAVILIVLFTAYLWRLRRSGESEEELIGVPAHLAELPRLKRWLATITLFVVAAGFIFASAEPFADALVSSGRRFGIDEFLLVQWLAPVASEAPEFIVAVVFAMRGRAGDGIGVLLASKVNQWTLLVGSLPVAYALGGGHGGLQLDPRQVEEFLLTASQTVLGIAVLLDLALRRWEAVALFILFSIQFFLPAEHARLWLSAIYAAIGVVLIAIRWRAAAKTLRGAVGLSIERVR